MAEGGIPDSAELEENIQAQLDEVTEQIKQIVLIKQMLHIILIIISILRKLQRVVFSILSVPVDTETQIILQSFTSPISAGMSCCLRTNWHPTPVPLCNCINNGHTQRDIFFF